MEKRGFREVSWWGGGRAEMEKREEFHVTCDGGGDWKIEKLSFGIILLNTKTQSSFSAEGRYREQQSWFEQSPQSFISNTELQSHRVFPVSFKNLSCVFYLHAIVGKYIILGWWWFGVGAEWGYSALRQKAKVQRRYSEGTAKGFRSYSFEIKGLKN